MVDIVESLHEALQGTFLKSAEEANELTAAVKRRRKFTPSSLAQALILALLQNPKASHDDIASVAAAGGVKVSPQAIEQRYSSSLAAFFKVLFGKMAKQIVASDVTLAPILSRFTEVILIDSSVIVLPDSQQSEFRSCGGRYQANQSAIKLQTEFNLLNGSLRCVEREQGRATDGATDRQQVIQSKGSLRIADLGYYSIPVLERIDNADAYYLSRFPHTTMVYVDGVKHNQAQYREASPGSGLVLGVQNFVINRSLPPIPCSSRPVLRDAEASVARRVITSRSSLSGLVRGLVQGGAVSLLVGEQGYSLAAVCRELQSHGIKTPSGNAKWSTTTVHDILRNPAYHSQARYGRQRMVPRKPGKRAKLGAPSIPRKAKVTENTSAEEQVIISVPALISVSLIEQVNSLVE